jgi:streptogramin lyase
MITYNKQSNFIKEFKIPNNVVGGEELGLKGITTDQQGNAWFYHGTNKSSTIIKLNPQNGNFTQYKVGGKTAHIITGPICINNIRHRITTILISIEKCC